MYRGSILDFKIVFLLVEESCIRRVRNFILKYLDVLDVLIELRKFFLYIL